MPLIKEHVIALVDCDCFFVSCERVDNPQLNNKPVCVTTGATSKGIIVSRSNEAKELGIKMGTPLFQLSGKFNNVHYIPARHNRYAEISKQVMTVLKLFTPDVEEVSIDEAYLDLTGMSKLYNLTYENLIKKIRQTVLEKTQIPVSIGLSTSKTLAKLASDKAKKNKGLFIIHPKKAKEILKNIELEEICGINHKTAVNFATKGIFTIDDFLQYDPHRIRQLFGIHGEKLRYELAGISVSPVNPVEEAPQSIQDTKALEDFTDNLNILENALSYHIHKASQKLRKQNGYCNTLSVMLRTKDFKVIEATVKLEKPTNSEQTLLKHAQELIKKIYQSKTLYRSVGITLKNLVYGKPVQQSLFEQEEREDDKISRLIDELEQKYGKQVVKLGI